MHVLNILRLSGLSNIIENFVTQIFLHEIYADADEINTNYSV